MGMESSLPLITLLNPDKVVSMLEINSGEESSPARAIKEVGDVGEWVTIFLCDFVEAPEIDTKLEGTIFLLDE